MAVETIYRKFIILGLIFNSFIIYAQRIIYVNGSASNSGDGSRQNPYKSFKTALNSAQDRDIIKILGKATERYGENGNPNQDSSGEPGRFIIDKEITIDGDGSSTLEFTGLNLSLTKDVIFKNLRLSLVPLTNLKDAFAGISKSSSYIFVNGNKITFNNIITKIENGNADTRPIIIAGTYKDTPDADRAEIIIENSPSNGEGRLKAIIAGNTNSQKNTPTTVTLDRNARVDEVFFGGVENSVTAKVVVVSESNYIKKYNATNSDDNLLELNGYTASYTPTFTNIKDLSLKSSTLFNLPPTTINRKLTINNSSRIGFIEPDPDRFYYANISINRLESEGGTVVLPNDVKMIVEGKASGTLNLEINQGRFHDRKEIIEANESSDITINFAPSNGFSLVKVLENGKAIWRTIDKNSIKISPVTNPQISFNDNTKTINVSWQKPDNTNGLTGYEIYEKGSKIHTINNVDELSFSKPITTNGTYSYDIYAIYSDQKSDAKQVSINISTIPDNPTPTPPTNNTNIAIGKVGINTKEPKVTLDIREIALDILPAGTPQGVNFPNLTTEQRETFDKTKIKEGTMIYNTSLKCLEFYDGSTWKCIQTKSN